MFALRIGDDMAWGLQNGFSIGLAALAVAICCGAPMEIAALPIAAWETSGAEEPNESSPQIARMIGDKAPRVEPPLAQAQEAHRDTAAAELPLASLRLSEPPALRSTGAARARNGDARAEEGTSGTLRQVLRAIVTIHAASLQPGDASERSLEHYDVTDGDDWVIGRISELILDSEWAGAALRTLVQVNSADAHGATFSILGVGDFAFDIAPDFQAVIISELSSGFALRTAFGNGGLRYGSFADYPSTAAASFATGQREQVDLMRLWAQWLLDILFSPAGILVSMMTSTIVVLWVFVKLVDALQRRASRAQRS
jgi:hypothetical protein